MKMLTILCVIYIPCITFLLGMYFGMLIEKIPYMSDEDEIDGWEDDLTNQL